MVTFLLLHLRNQGGKSRPGVLSGFVEQDLVYQKAGGKKGLVTTQSNNETLAE